MDNGYGPLPNIEPEPFSAFTVGAATLPFCLPRIDVDDYLGTGQPVFMYTTLSGRREGTRNGRIAESRMLASKLYWLLAMVRGHANHNGGLNRGPLAVTDVLHGNNDYDAPEDDDPETPPVVPLTLEERITQPKERVCSDTTFEKYADVGELEEDERNFAKTAAALMKTTTVALYKGDEFIGYSASQLNAFSSGQLGVPNTGFYAAGLVQAGVGIGGYIPVEGAVFGGLREEYAYIQIGGMNFVSAAYATEGFGGNAVATLDPLIPSASTSYDRNGFTWTAEAAFDGEPAEMLEFLTYDPDHST